MTPAERGKLAARMVPVAARLAGMVRDEDAAAIGVFLSKLTGEETRALLVVQAAMIPDDQTPADLLGWVTWDEHGHSLDGADVTAGRRAAPGDGLQPCGTYAAFRRHEDRGEPVDGACRDAARAYWSERKRAQAQKRGAA